MFFMTASLRVKLFLVTTTVKDDDRCTHQIICVICRQEREKLKEEKKRQEEIQREWSKIREDLECEDLKVICAHYVKII